MIDRRLTPSCPHEDDVLALVSIGQWPDRADAALIAHASSCPVCADLATAASAIIDLRDEAPALPAIPDASLVWYRAQMRARMDAARHAMRPMVLAQVVAVAVIVMLTATWLGAGATGLSTWWHWLRGLVPASPDVAQFDFSTTSRLTGSAVIAGVVGLVVLALGALGFYLADVSDTAPRLTPRRRS